MGRLGRLRLVKEEDVDVSGVGVEPHELDLLAGGATDRRQGDQIFKLVSEFTPAGDQPEAIDLLSCGIDSKVRSQVLLGVTGSGKTFTIAQVIARTQRPALVMAPNKTLAAQLYAELKDFFPDNAVEYFVSYYDYYQPEAYIPQSDTYIEKDSSINDRIDKMRHSATRSLLTRRDVIIVASVSCIYGLGSPDEYKNMCLLLKVGDDYPMEEIQRRLVYMLYERNEVSFYRGVFRVRGDVLEIFPAYEDELAVRLEMFGDTIEAIRMIDPLRGAPLQEVQELTIFAGSHFVTSKQRLQKAMTGIKEELKKQLALFEAEKRLVEAQRLEQRTNFDLEMISELGYCNGIENYSRHLTGRRPGEPPPTLLDYFSDDFLLVMDESHISVPQVRGMYRGDRSRKETLVGFGFRLPSALDNRPLRFEEFEERRGQTLYVSATPGEEELGLAGGHVVEQVVRPTGLLDPAVDVRPVEGQVDDLLGEIRQRAERQQRTLVTTLTKRMAEDLTEYYRDLDVRVEYLHSEVQTLDRVRILRDLRRGEFDALIGVNLLREGLDLPEVSLVAILDADKEGYLRSERSLIQTIGRAARHVEGRTILYADRVTGSMQRALDETERRREIQQRYNEEHDITPESVRRAIDDLLGSPVEADYSTVSLEQPDAEAIFDDLEALEEEVQRLEREMRAAAERLEFEQAAQLRDRIRYLRTRAILA